MRAVLVLMIGLVFGFVTPDLGEAHSVSQNDRGGGYSQHADDHRGHNDGWRQNGHRHQQKAWKKHHKQHRKAHYWRKQHHHRPARVIYRDGWSYPLFPGIVIHLPL